jgi:hypothetical protein
MKLEDAFFNWLQIKIVADARTDDGAANETLQFFETILIEDHKLEHFAVDRTDDHAYYIHFTQDGNRRELKYDRELVEKLLDDINSNPKYN